MKDVEIEKPTSFLDHVYSGCTQRETRKLLDTTTRCLNPVILLEQPRNYQDGTNFEQKLQRGPTTWKDMLENAWNGIANWQTKKTEQQYKVSQPCLDDHQIKKEELENKGELSEVCSQIVLKCLYLARKTTQQLSKVSTPCLDDHNSKKKNWDLLEICQKYALTLS